MQIIQGGRLSGKTFALACMVHDNPGAIMIVHSVIEKRRVVSTYRLNPKQVVAVSELDRHKLAGCSKVLVDNAEEVMAVMFGKRPDVLTVTELPWIKPAGLPDR